MFGLDILQVFGVIFGFASGIGCVFMGIQESTGEFRSHMSRIDDDTNLIQVAGHIDTGFDGGAIGLGIICGVCFLSIVLIQIAKFKMEKKA